VSKKISPLSSRKFCRLLARGNAKIVRQRGTSHAVFEREKEGRVYRAPVIMAKAELSSVYMKLVMHQLGFTDEEIDAILE
jgi:predicted RNA binding protein YcfA (HicA-like mRNA interferase family)